MDPSETSESILVHRSQIVSIGHIYMPYADKNKVQNYTCYLIQSFIMH